MALALAAGPAIENAQVLARARQRERWQAGITQLTSDLLADLDATVGDGYDAGVGTSSMAVHRLLVLACGAANAQGAALAVDHPDAAGTTCVADAVGALSGWAGHLDPLARSVTEAARRADTPIAVADVHDDPRTGAPAGRASGIGAWSLPRSPVTLPCPGRC